MDTAPTRDELRAAFDRVRKDHWTVTFDEYIADPLHVKILTLVAKYQGVGRDIPSLRYHVIPRKLPPKQTPIQGYKPGPLDRKRLAAGEREDD